MKIASRINDIERSAIITSYIAGSVMMVAASALNPLPHAVVQSGLPAGFGLTAGLLFVRGGSQPLPKSRAWIAAGTAVAATFIALLGPGIAIAP